MFLLMKMQSKKIILISFLNTHAPWLINIGVRRAAKTSLEAVIVQKVNAEADSAPVLQPIVNVIQMFVGIAGWGNQHWSN
jgi:hypothetical protein